MFFHDVRHALRLLVREPGFTLAAVLTLALGVGANVAVFAVVNAALLRPLPYPDADRLVLLEHRDRRTGITKEFIAMGDFVDLRARQQAFESLAAYGGGPATIFGEGEPFDVAILQATPDLLDLLRRAAGRSAGRSAPTMRRQGAAPVVMLGYDTLAAALRRRPGVVGRSIRIGHARCGRSSASRRAGFRFPAEREDRRDRSRCACRRRRRRERKSGWVFAVGAAEARRRRCDRRHAELAAISRQMEQEYPGREPGIGVLRAHAPRRDGRRHETAAAAAARRGRRWCC